MTIVINVSFQRYELFQIIQTRNDVTNAKRMIQNVKTRWNNIYFMLKRVFFLRDIIQFWLSDQSRMQILKVKNAKWDQVSFILDMLKFFQETIEILTSSNQSFIHKAWIMYNALHQHLKRFENNLSRSARNSFVNLRLTVNATQKKLTKYYETIFDAKELYFNLVICSNSCDKLNYYNVSSTALYHALCRAARHNSSSTALYRALCRAARHNSFFFMMRIIYFEQIELCRATRHNSRHILFLFAMRIIYFFRTDWIMSRDAT